MTDFPQGRVLSEDELSAEYQFWHNALMLLGDSQYESVARPTIEQAIADRDATIRDREKTIAGLRESLLHLRDYARKCWEERKPPMAWRIAGYCGEAIVALNDKEHCEQVQQLLEDE